MTCPNFGLKEVHSGPFDSDNCTGAAPDKYLCHSCVQATLRSSLTTFSIILKTPNSGRSTRRTNASQAPLVHTFSRGFAKGVSRTVSLGFFSENETEKNGRKTEKTEENGKKKRKKTEKKRKKREKIGIPQKQQKRKKRKETGKIGSDTVPATPFAKPRFSSGNSYAPTVLKVLLKFPLHWHWSMDGSSQQLP